MFNIIIHRKTIMYLYYYTFLVIIILFLHGQDYGITSPDKKLSYFRCVDCFLIFFGVTGFVLSFYSIRFNFLRYSISKSIISFIVIEMPTVLLSTIMLYAFFLSRALY